jgi:uncharacterized protein (TIGR01244 family)
MDIRQLSDTYAVSPQIAPEDVAALKAAGYVAIICNRPDPEVPPGLHAERIAEAAAAEGLAFTVNPVVHGALGMDNVVRQGEAIAAADGPILAYCASGNRSSIVWALSQAGTIPTDDLIEAAARGGYNLEPFRDQIDRLATI